MTYYLVIYSRSSGEGSVVARFASSRRADAMKARFEAEAEFAGDPNTEVVVLGATSEQALRRTHARYFDSADDLVSQAVHAVG